VGGRRLQIRFDVTAPETLRAVDVVATVYTE